LSVLALTDLVHDIPVLGPIGVGIGTLGTTWAQVLAADSQRRGVVFHNPGSQNLRVAPANLTVQPSAGQGAILIYPDEEFELYADDEHMNCSQAWMAWVDSGSNQPISILNFTGANPAVTSPPMPLAQLNQGSIIASPNGSGVLLTTASASAIGANPVRRGITFHNPGTVNLAVCPANLAAVIGAGGITLLPGETKTFMARSKSRVRVNCGWNAIAASGTNNPLTILEHLG
jgi:hypothetical protein